MSLMRTTLSLLGLVGLAVGYAASQWAFFRGDVVAYAETATHPAVKAIALLFLVTALVLACVPDKEGVES